MKKKFIVVLATLGLVIILAVSASAIEKEELLKVKTKMEEAAKYLSEKKEAVLPEFNDKNSRWLQEPYVTVVELNGLFLSHPNPAMVGKNLLHLTDGKGKKFILEGANVANTRGRGWIEYWWNKPGEKEPAHKVSFVMKVPNTNWFMVSGIYENAALKEVIDLVGE